MNGGLRGIRIGRVFGITIAFDPSWLFIVVLMTWSLTVGFSRWHPGWGFGASFGLAVAAALLFFLSVVLHELAHSLVARRFGVPVRSITLFLFGGVSNIEREPPSAKAEFLTAVVGPLTSIVLGVVLLLIGSLATSASAGFVAAPEVILSSMSPGETLLMWLGSINLIVGVFNLIPGFPLDGGRLLRSAIWASTHDLHAATRWAAGVGQAIGWVFVFLGVAMAFGAQVPFFGRGLVSGLWLAFIGWFLSSAAAQSWRTQLVHEVLEGLTVSRLMHPPPQPVPVQADVATFVHEWLMRSDERAFPVADDAGRVVGLVTMHDVRGVPREGWPHVAVAHVMTPGERLVTASPRDDLAEALDKLTRAGVSQLPVFEGEALVGMLRRSDIARWIELHARPPARTHAPT